MIANTCIVMLKSNMEDTDLTLFFKLANIPSKAKPAHKYPQIKDTDRKGIGGCQPNPVKRNLSIVPYN